MGRGAAEDHKRLAPENRELRAKIAELRLENQRLYVALERFRGARHLLRELLAAGWQGLRRTLGRRRSSKQRPPGRDPSDDSSFRPYRIQPVHASAPIRPRVLHAVANFATGGSARLVVDLVERLGHKFEQEVITRDDPRSAGYVGLTIHDCRHITSDRSLRSLFRRFKPELVHVHFLGHHTRRRPDGPARSSELDWWWYHYVFQAAQEHGCRVVENLNIPVDPYISEAVDCYVYVSEYVKQRFASPDGRALVIYPGSDLSFFSRRAGEDIPDDCLGMVYRLEGDKLNERSIQPLIEVIRRRSRTKAIVVGGGRYLETYREAAERAGVREAVTFTGYVSYGDLPALYERMSVFVAPVHTESFGQVSSFAMHMGIPVVGYAVGALPEIVGDPSLLAPPGDSSRLADLTADLLDDRQRRLDVGAANRRRAQRLFSLETMTGKYEALYDELIASAVEAADA